MDMELTMLEGHPEEFRRTKSHTPKELKGGLFQEFRKQSSEAICKKQEGVNGGNVERCMQNSKGTELLLFFREFRGVLVCLFPREREREREADAIENLV